MGIYSTAYLVYGWNVASDTWNVDDLSEHLEERLQGSELGFYLDGSADWHYSECDLVITVREAPSYSACQSVLDLSPDAFDFELTQVGGAVMQTQAKHRLGITLEGYPRWHLGCSIG